MNEEIKKALAAARASLLASEALENFSIAKAARAAVSPGDPILAHFAETERVKGADDQLRMYAEQAARTPALAPQMAEFAASIKRLSEPATALVGESTIARMLQSVKVDMSGHNELLRHIDRYRESFVVDAKLNGLFRRDMAASERPGVIASISAGAQRTIASFVASQEASATSISRLAVDASALHAESVARITKSFVHIGKLNKAWELPVSFVSLFEKAGASAKLLESMRLPIIDIASAAAIARAWGAEGVDRQLAALGIETSQSAGESQAPKRPEGRQREHMSAKARLFEFLTLFSVVFAIYAFMDSQKMEARIIGENKKQGELRERQIEALRALILAAAERQEKAEKTRFVVLQRPARIRFAPEHGSSVIGVAFPNQVLRPVLEAGKWIQVEYYDLPAQQYKIGWALKKYFVRAVSPEVGSSDIGPSSPRAAPERPDFSSRDRP